MIRNAFVAVLLLWSSLVQGQFVVAPATTVAVLGSPDIIIESKDDINFSPAIDWGTAQVSLLLWGNGHNLVTGSQNTIGALAMRSGDYSVKGKWVVKNDIDFRQGILITPATFLTDRLIYEGSDLLAKSSGVPSAASYVKGPFFIRGQGGTLTFPVGNSSGYFPAQLSTVTDPAALVGIECALGDPQIPADSLSADVDKVFTQWYWKLSVISRGTYSGSPISLSLDQTDTFLGNEKPVVIEKDSASYINDLSGSLNNSFVTSTRSVHVKGIYALAVSKDVGIKIHKVITPNGDAKNETLVIEGLDFYPQNKVMLLDRWGAVYLERDNFLNYSDPTVPQQGDFDYTKLNNGNYICTVQFTDSSGKTHKVKPQMISVLK
jgi:gliding motility-associated-like protein